jgi:uncharacterized protein (UPF0261 family)
MNDLPGHSSRVERRLQPTQITFLEFIIDINDLQIISRNFLENSNGSVAPMVASRDSDALGPVEY